MTDVVVPDSIEPLELWRGWRISPDGYLQSLYNDYRWPVRERAVASCWAVAGEWLAVSHPSMPREGCTCGIYAVEHPTLVSQLASKVLGTVKLWGKIIQGERGARAEFAYPSMLLVESKKTARRLRDYGVPVQVNREMFKQYVVSDGDGLCPLVTPYYSLQVTPVASLIPSLKLHSGGIKYERPD